MNFARYKPNHQSPSLPIYFSIPLPTFPSKSSLNSSVSFQENKRDFNSLMKDLPFLNESLQKNDFNFLRKSLKITNKHKFNEEKVETIINKKKIKDFHVIGVFSNKILLFYDPFLLNIVALDQHAIHERICYEILCEKLDFMIKGDKMKNLFEETILFLNKNKEKNFNFSNFYHKFLQKKHWFSIENCEEIMNLAKFQKEFYQWGFEFNVEFGEKRVEISKIPMIFDEYIDLSVNYNDFLNFFKGKQLRNHRYPAFIDKIIMEKSCKNAVKFNDKLNKKQILQLKNNIGHCNYAFVCIHGRNSMFPILNLR